MTEKDILFQDRHLVACLKAPGLLSETGGMPELLADLIGGSVYCVHRLDRAVGGVMVYARTKEAAAALSGAIAAGKMKKRYLAVVCGRPQEKEAVWRDLLYHDAERNKSYVVKRMRRGVREAELSYALVDAAENGGEELSLLDIELHTGRSHQIRVQFASRSLPLAGDGRYGSPIRNCEIALWSAQIEIPHPISGKVMRFSAPPPEIFPWTVFTERNRASDLFGKPVKNKEDKTLGLC